MLMTNPKTNTEQAVIFLHILKTAGTTLHRIIERNYQPEDIYFMDADTYNFEHLTNLSEADRAKIRMLRGHMVFGLHKYLPGPSTYFTVLRDPVERAISTYYFIRRTPEHHWHDLITSNEMSLLEFLESKVDIEVYNFQTRVLAGGEWHNSECGECPEEAVEVAKRHLQEYFAVVGLVERFDETLHLLKRAFGWRDLFYIPQHVGTNRLRRDELPPATLDAVIEANQLDIRLYQYMTELFEEQLRQQGLVFAAEVKLFQLVNQRLLPLVHNQQVRKGSLRGFIQKRTRNMLRGMLPPPQQN